MATLLVSYWGIGLLHMMFGMWVQRELVLPKLAEAQEEGIRYAEPLVCPGCGETHKPTWRRLFWAWVLQNILLVVALIALPLALLWPASVAFEIWLWRTRR